MGRKIIGITVGTPTKPKSILDKMQLDWVATKKEVGGDTVVISEQILTSGMWNRRQMDIQPDITYEVYINDTRYSCVAFNEDGGICLGNNPSMTENDYPFCIYWAGGSATAGFFYKDISLSYPLTLKVTYGIETVYDKMPVEYLPEGVVLSVNGLKPDADGNVEIETGGGSGGGLNTEAANLLIYILRRATYQEDVSSQIGRLEEILLGDTDSGLLITDDGNGNVSITTFGSATITDDGDGNVTITVPEGVSITDDGNGNIVVIA